MKTERPWIGYIRGVEEEIKKANNDGFLKGRGHYLIRQLREQSKGQPDSSQTQYVLGALEETCRAIERGTYLILSAFESVLPLLEMSASKRDEGYQSEVLSQLRELSQRLQDIDRSIGRQMI